MSASVDVALDAPARALIAHPCALDADVRSRFVAVTNALTRANVGVAIDYIPDTKRARTHTLFTLPDAAAAFDIDGIDGDNGDALFAIVYEDVGCETTRRRGCGVARAASEEASGTGTGTFDVLRVRDDNQGASGADDDDAKAFETVKCARFHASRGTLMTVDEFKARAWTRTETGYRATTSMVTRRDSSRSMTIGGMNTIQDGVASGSWDPNDSEVFACGIDADVAMFDVRSGERAQTIVKAHAPQTRDVKYNPNVAHEIMTCGDDGLVKIWDTRAHAQAMKIIPGHDHWIWRCAYNPVYDALFLTASSDGGVRLWNDDTKSPQQRDRSSASRSAVRLVTKRSNERSISVHSCAWSAVDPWTYASINASGVVSICDVPREEKYRILL
jgi:hypothetical protein